MRTSIKKFYRLSFEEKQLAFFALYWLTIAQLAISLLLFRHVARFLGEHMKKSQATPSKRQKSVAEQVARVIPSVARRLPWRSKCLDQAIAAKWMLRRRQIASTLYFGVTKNDSKAIEAHAWLSCGDHVVTGADGMKAFKEIAHFS